jgi:hypothetical protein
VIHIIPALRRLSLEDLKFEVSLGYTVRPCLKNKTRGWEGSSVVEYLPSIHKALGSISRTTKVNN